MVRRRRNAKFRGAHLLGDRDLPENGLNIRRPAAVHAWLAAYAAATSTAATSTKVLDAATGSRTEW